MGDKKQNAPTVALKQKPLQYGTLRMVLLCMEPSLRLKISLHVPTLRPIEKSIPLKIDSLDFLRFNVTINKAEFELGIVRDFHSGHKVTPEILSANLWGGLQCDLDQFGFAADQTIKNLSEDLKKPTKMNAEIRLKEIRKAKDCWDERIRLTHYVEDTKPPYDSFIQLSIPKTKTLERDIISKKPYNVKLTEAFEKLISILFEGRSTITEVKKLELEIRLPESLKFKVQKLIIPDYVPPNIHKSSFPLNRLEVTQGIENFDSINKKTKKLVLIGRCKIRQEQFPHLPRHVVLNAPCFEHVDMIRYWMENPREIGTCIKTLFFWLREAEQKFETVKNAGFPMADLDERNLSIPINHYSQIKLSIEEEVEPEEVEYSGTFPPFQCTLNSLVLKMEVVAC